VTRLDRVLQQWRLSKVAPFVGRSTRLLDIGCADGAMFRRFPHVAEFVGIDPDVERSGDLAPRAKLLRGLFPEALADHAAFDVITLLAVLEHVPPEAQPALAANCARYLAPGGRLVITVPSPVVDRILALLKFLRLIDGMSVEQHYGFDARTTPRIFTAAGLRLVRAERFQLGVNNLFVFEKPSPP
jgi:2-polyprenyl-3-methyl-5-hydroxy-6-metoxy-1,4-benzoquinol methylase